jgi:hypothetical protein
MGLFKKGKKGKFVAIPLSESQKASDKFLQGLVEQDINIPTQQIAGLSDLEQAGLKKISALQDIDASGISQQAAEVLRGTLAGDFDPRTSPFYKGFRQEAGRIKQEGISDVLRRSQRITGAPAGTALRQTGDVAGRADENSLQVLGGLFEQERGRQFNAIGQGLNLPGGIGSILMNAGALPRGIEQNILNAQFQQQMGQIQAPFQLQAPIAQNIMNQQRFNYRPGQQGSTWAQDVAGIANIAGTVMTGMPSQTPGGGGAPGQSSFMNFGSTGRGFQSFLGGGGQLNSGQSSIGDLNTGFGGASIPPGFGSPGFNTYPGGNNLANFSQYA